MKKPTKPKRMNRERLYREYLQARQDHQNLLQWCAAKAYEYGLSYGAFVDKLGV